MSLLTVVMSDTFVSIMTDGRATEINPDGSYGRIISDNQEKIFPVGRDFFYSFTGVVEPAESFISATGINAPYSGRNIL